MWCKLSKVSKQIQHLISIVWFISVHPHYSANSACPKANVSVSSTFYFFAEIAVACGHFSAALHLCVEPGEDPDKQAFSK